MAKITVHGGATDQTAPLPAPAPVTVLVGEHGPELVAVQAEDVLAGVESTPALVTRRRGVPAPRRTTEARPPLPGGDDKDGEQE